MPTQVDEKKAPPTRLNNGGELKLMATLKHAGKKGQSNG